MKKIIPLLCAAFALSLSHTVGAAEDLSAKKKADIKEILELTGVIQATDQVAEMMSGQLSRVLRQSRPDIPENAHDDIRQIIKDVTQENVPALIDELVPVYHEYYSHDEIKGILKFYRTDLGKKVAQNTPAIRQAGGMATQKWAQMLGPKIRDTVMTEMEKKGIDLSPPQAPAAGQ